MGLMLWFTASGRGASIIGLLGTFRFSVATGNYLCEFIEVDVSGVYNKQGIKLHVYTSKSFFTTRPGDICKSMKRIFDDRLTFLMSSFHVQL